MQPRGPYPNVAVLTRESPGEARVSSAFNTQLGSRSVAASKRAGGNSEGIAESGIDFLEHSGNEPPEVTSDVRTLEIGVLHTDHFHRASR